MQLDMHEVTEIIDAQRRIVILSATAAAMDEGTEEAKKAVEGLVQIINAYTAGIARAIQKAEDERVEAMMDGMAEESATRCIDGKRCIDCKHWDVPKRRCGAWDQRGSSGPCDLFKPREASE